MTSAQIEWILDQFGYVIDEWISLVGITMISLTQDSAILINPLTMRFKFDSEEDVLEIAYGNTINSTFVPIKGSSIDIEPNSFVSFKNIHGLISSVYISPYGSIYQKYFGNKSKM